jgi:DNA-binding XRE family transcriptional regulator
MLEAVKMRLTSKIAGGTVFTFEGKNIPDHLVLYLKSAFPDVEEIKSDIDDEEYVEWDDTELAKQIRSDTTPAESLKLLRTTFGYTQQALAEKVGITKQQISSMERGKTPIGRKMAHRLANALGTSYKNLFW